MTQLWLHLLAGFVGGVAGSTATYAGTRVRRRLAARRARAIMFELPEEASCR